MRRRSKRFTREAARSREFRASTSPRVIDVGREGPHPFIVMEYLRGSDLSALQKGEAVPDRRGGNLRAASM